MQRKRAILTLAIVLSVILLGSIQALSAIDDSHVVLWTIGSSTDYNLFHQGVESYVWNTNYPPFGPLSINGYAFLNDGVPYNIRFLFALPLTAHLEKTTIGVSMTTIPMPEPYTFNGKVGYRWTEGGAVPYTVVFVYAVSGSITMTVTTTMQNAASTGYVVIGGQTVATFTVAGGGQTATKTMTVERTTTKTETETRTTTIYTSSPSATTTMTKTVTQTLYQPVTVTATVTTTIATTISRRVLKVEVYGARAGGTYPLSDATVKIYLGDGSSFDSPTYTGYPIQEFSYAPYSLTLQTSKWYYVEAQYPRVSERAGVWVYLDSTSASAFVCRIYLYY